MTEHDRSTLGTAFGLAQRQELSALAILRDGETWAEEYWNGGGPRTSKPIASVTKTVVSLLIGACIQLGHIRDVNTAVAEFLPEWGSPPYSKILLRHLLSMTSGIRKSALWGLDPAPFSGSRLPELVHAPGTHWEYNTAAYQLLFRIIEESTGSTLAQATNRFLIEPLALEDTRWLMRGRGASTNYFTLSCSACDLARIGHLLVSDGEWKGRQLVRASHVEAMRFSSQRLNPTFGYLLWVNRGPKRIFPSAPRDTVVGLGAHNTRLFALPSHGTVVVCLGANNERPIDRAQPHATRRGTFDDELLAGVCTALQKAGVG